MGPAGPHDGSCSLPCLACGVRLLLGLSSPSRCPGATPTSLASWPGASCPAPSCSLLEAVPSKLPRAAAWGLSGVGDTVARGPSHKEVPEGASLRGVLSVGILVPSSSPSFWLRSEERAVCSGSCHNAPSPRPVPEVGGLFPAMSVPLAPTMWPDLGKVLMRPQKGPALPDGFLSPPPSSSISVTFPGSPPPPISQVPQATLGGAGRL